MQIFRGDVTLQAQDRHMKMGRDSSGDSGNHPDNITLFHISATLNGRKNMGVNRNELVHGIGFLPDKNGISKKIFCDCDNLAGAEKRNFCFFAKAMQPFLMITIKADIHPLMRPGPFTVAGPPFFRFTKSHARQKMECSKSSPQVTI